MVARNRLKRSGRGVSTKSRLKREEVADLIIVTNRETGQVETFPSVAAVLREINRDRSGEWTRYDKTDWREGLKDFTEYNLIAVMRNGKVIREK